MITTSAVQKKMMMKKIMRSAPRRLHRHDRMSTESESEILSTEEEERSRSDVKYAQANIKKLKREIGKKKLLKESMRRKFPLRSNIIIFVPLPHHRFRFLFSQK